MLKILLTQLPKLKPMIEGSVTFIINYLIRTSYTIPPQLCAAENTKPTVHVTISSSRYLQYFTS